MSGLISVEEARARLLDGIEPLGAEVVTIQRARDRVLAADVTAPRDQPLNDMSSMDGYAVPASLPTGTHDLRVVGTAAAGQSYGSPLATGEALRIFTGGVVPEGARVVVQEQAERHGNAVRLAILDGDSSHVRPAGSDYRAGARLLARGERVSGPRLAILAAADSATVEVVCRPRTLVLASGDELAPPGEAGARVVNSGAYGLAGLVEAWGGVAKVGAILPDDLEVCTARFAALSDAELVVTIGGASVGERDVLREAAKVAGYSIVFAGVAVKPGKPLWSATKAGAPRLLGVPGNPASALVGARLLAVPFLAACLGQDPDVVLHALPARLGTSIEANGSRESHLRARLSLDGEGRLTAWPAGSQDSGLMTPFVEGVALLRRPIDAPALKAGAIVEALPMEPLPWRLAP